MGMSVSLVAVFVFTNMEVFFFLIFDSTIAREREIECFFFIIERMLSQVS